MKVGRLTTQIKNEFLSQALEYMANGDEYAIKELWSGFTTEEKIVLWGWFTHSYERRAFKKFLED